MKKLNSKSKVIVIGSGEAFDSDLGNTAYLFVGVEKRSVLFDCGYQIPERLWQKNQHQQIDTICLTHLHADHSFGIVPLLVRYWEENRKKPLWILGPKGTEPFITKLLNMGYPGIQKRFEFNMHFVTLNPKKPQSLGDLKFTVARTVHSILNYTVRVDYTENAQPHSFSISGDGQITSETKKLVHDVDLHFQEVYGAEPKIPVHADLKTVYYWAKESKIKKLFISHLSRSEKNKIKVRAKRSKIQISEPGMEIFIK